MLTYIALIPFYSIQLNILRRSKRLHIYDDTSPTSKITWIPTNTCIKLLCFRAYLSISFYNSIQFIIDGVRVLLCRFTYTFFIFRYFRLKQTKRNKLHLPLLLCMNMRDIYTSCSLSKHTIHRFYSVYSPSKRKQKTRRRRKVNYF